MQYIFPHNLILKNRFPYFLSFIKCLLTTYVLGIQNVTLQYPTFLKELSLEGEISMIANNCKIVWKNL